MSDIDESFYAVYVLLIWYLVGLSLIFAPSGFDIVATTRDFDPLFVVTFIMMAVPIGFFAWAISGFIWLIFQFFVDGVKEKDFYSVAAALWLLTGLLMYFGVF